MFSAKLILNKTKAMLAIGKAMEPPVSVILGMAPLTMSVVDTYY